MTARDPKATQAPAPINVIFDMETQDPDDYLTLLMLLGHPLVRLKAVTITPGSPYQVGLVRRTLEEFGVDIPVGAYDISHPKPCVSKWHERAYGDLKPSYDAAPAGMVLANQADEDCTLITGAPLKNLGEALKRDHFRLGRWVAQGGFAGQGVVPEHLQMDKFRGRITCPTFNFNGAPAAALEALKHPNIGPKWLVSKNVCHKVVYDRALHEQLTPLKDNSLSLSMIWKGMDHYLRRKEGKKFHDPLAACCAIDPDIGEWAEVEMFRERGEWGAKPKTGSHTQIIIDYDHERFIEVLTMC